MKRSFYIFNQYHIIEFKSLGGNVIVDIPDNIIVIKKHKEELCNLGWVQAGTYGKLQWLYELK